MKEFKIFIFTAESSTFLLRKESPEFSELKRDNILWADSSKNSREFYLNENLGQWLFFMDLDCQLGPQTLYAINDIIEKANSTENMIFAGVYENPDSRHLLQRVHNFIANGWLEHSFVQGEEVLLGGVFLIRSRVKIEQPTKIFWGAEDKGLALILKKQNFIFSFRRDLKVIHHTSKSFRHFVRRAWLHGVNDIHYLPQTNSGVNFRYWLRKVDFADLALVLLIVFHFCIQKAGLQFQKFRQVSK